MLDYHGISYLIVLTKCDKVGGGALHVCAVPHQTCS